MNAFRQIGWLIRKDLALQFRTKDTLALIFVFSVLVVLIFCFAFGPIFPDKLEERGKLAASVLWATFLFANGEVYDMYGLTAAHKTLPLNTIVRVTNLNNGKSLILRINDRGPYVKGRILDCSYGAALKLGFVGEGTTKVKIEVMELGDNKYMKHKS